MIGVAVGGLLGFITTLILISRSTEIIPTFAFIMPTFWEEFILALLTAFWETLFFFSFVMLVVQQIFKNWTFLQHAMFVSLVFLIFHLPNIALRFQGVNLWYQTGLLALFALGQALLFTREKNGYSLVISHALWGLVLLFHF